MTNVMKKTRILLDARPAAQDLLTAKEYLDLTSRQKRNIQKIRIVPPRLGSKNFGAFEVHYKSPVYKAG